MNKIISHAAIKRRQYWIEKIRKLSGNFGADIERLEKELDDEIDKSGIAALIDHLQICANIPGSYGHDTSEEKLYSKYTDCLLSLAYKKLGLKSLLIKERAEAADVEVLARNYSFVADAKSFLVGLPKIRRTLKFKQSTFGDVVNFIQCLYAQFTNFQTRQVKFTSKQLHEMFVFLLILTLPCY